MQMRVSIIAVGRQKRSPEQGLFADYQKRAVGQGRNLGITGIVLRELPESAASTAAMRKVDEAQRIVAAIPHRAVVLALDEHGRQLTSIDLAASFRGWLDGGVADVVFLIGGPDGQGDGAMDRAQMSISLGIMTWPHGLVRVMLAEQIYRTVTILLNHPYHRA